MHSIFPSRKRASGIFVYEYSKVNNYESTESPLWSGILKKKLPFFSQRETLYSATTCWICKFLPRRILYGHTSTQEEQIRRPEGGVWSIYKFITPTPCSCIDPGHKFHKSLKVYFFRSIKVLLCFEPRSLFNFGQLRPSSGVPKLHPRYDFASDIFIPITISPLTSSPPLQRNSPG